MKNIIKHSWILIIMVIIFLILNFYKSNKKILEDIMVFGLWDYSSAENEYKLSLQKTVEIDVFMTIKNNIYKKMAPGSSGSFILKFKRPENSDYKIINTEKTSKPQNLIFFIGNKKYNSLKEMEYIINEKFSNTDKITVYWEWEYYIVDVYDLQDTNDGKNAQSYLFEINAIVEERTENES